MQSLPVSLPVGSLVIFSYLSVLQTDAIRARRFYLAIDREDNALC